MKSFILSLGLGLVSIGNCFAQCGGGVSVGSCQDNVFTQRVFVNTFGQRVAVDRFGRQVAIDRFGRPVRFFDDNELIRETFVDNDGIIRSRLVRRNLAVPVNSPAHYDYSLESRVRKLEQWIKEAKTNVSTTQTYRPESDTKSWQDKSDKVNKWKNDPNSVWSDENQKKN